MKTLLILIDGMRPEAMDLCGSSVPGELKKHSYYTMKAQTVWPSVTLPCHMSLFHSVEPGRHGILTNTYVPQVRPVDGICEVLRRAGKTSAMFYSWEELKDLARPASLLRSGFAAGNMLGDRAGELVLHDACACLTEDKPDFCFLYFGSADSAGHDYGWMGKEYLESVRQSLDWAMQAIRTAGEEYTVILTADHGGHGRIHGDNIPEDMTIPVLIHHPSFPEKELGMVSILDIAPTVAGILGVEASPDWEGKAIV